ALSQRGIDCAVIMPLYAAVKNSGLPLQRLPHVLAIPQSGRTIAGRLWRTTLPNSTVPVFLVEQADFFERDDPAAGHGLYQLTGPDGRPGDYLDNSARFGFFARAILD